jgi:hypothetical protein
MPNNPERPFGRSTLKLSAVFVPEAAKDEVSGTNISRTLGHGSLKIPAIFVPEGGDRPGHPYQHFGKAVFSRVEGRNDGRTVTAQRPSWHSPDASSPSPDALWEALTASSNSLDSSSQSQDSPSQSPAFTSDSPNSMQEASKPVPTPPRTRYRFGAALAGSPPRPPNPTWTGGKSDPVRKGVQVWNATKDAARTALRNLRTRPT